MSATEDTPRRMTAAWVIERLTEHREHAPRVPTFEVDQKAPTAEQVKAGMEAFYQWSAAVPVCDEFPTADLAFEAAKRYTEELRRLYPPKYRDDDLGEKLRESVTEISAKRGQKESKP
jgi:hypothetical protein